MKRGYIFMLKKYSCTLLTILTLIMFTGCSVKHYELPSQESSQNSLPIDTNSKTDELTLPKSSSSTIIQNLAVTSNNDNPNQFELPIKMTKNNPNTFFKVSAKQGDHTLVYEEVINENNSIKYFQLFDLTTPVYFQLSDYKTNQILFERTYYLN